MYVGPIFTDLQVTTRSPSINLSTSQPINLGYCQINFNESNSLKQKALLLLFCKHVHNSLGIRAIKLQGNKENDIKNNLSKVRLINNVPVAQMNNQHHCRLCYGFCFHTQPKSMVYSIYVEMRDSRSVTICILTCNSFSSFFTPTLLVPLFRRGERQPSLVLHVIKNIIIIHVHYILLMPLGAHADIYNRPQDIKLHTKHVIKFNICCFTAVNLN